MFRRCVLLACCVYAVWAAQLAGNNVVTDEHGDVYSIEQTERKTGGMEMTIKDSQGVNVLRVLNVEGVHIEIPSDRKVCIIRDVLNELEAAKCFEEVPYTDKVPDAVRSLCAGMEIIKARSLKDCKEDPTPLLGSRTPSIPGACVADGGGTLDGHAGEDTGRSRSTVPCPGAGGGSGSAIVSGVTPTPYGRPIHTTPILSDWVLKRRCHRRIQITVTCCHRKNYDRRGI
ncbi:hypothetical protein MAR_023310 [Mya arenaria]|uniref:Uncharacterized protein n=1 Tax=Mya arenaria TaxID=6604 RepID=A0ABY7DML9_MYAAR|nr:hypothetical protein MAR_023310 [Mya arenaria]